jgi:hypothetical protein
MQGNRFFWWIFALSIFGLKSLVFIDISSSQDTSLSATATRTRTITVTPSGPSGSVTATKIATKTITPTITVTAQGTNASATATRTRTITVTPWNAYSTPTIIATALHSLPFQERRKGLNPNIKTFMNSGRRVLALQVELPSQVEQEPAYGEVRVFAQNGQLVLSKREQITETSGKGLLNLATQNLKNGIYIVKLKITQGKNVTETTKKIAIYGR